MTGVIYQNTKREQVDRHGPPCRYAIREIIRTTDPNCPRWVIAEYEGTGYGTWICGADTRTEVQRMWWRCFGS